MSDAFETRLVRELEVIKGLARHLARDRNDADDLLQETAMRALIGKPNYVESGKFRPWLICKRMQRERNRHPVESLERTLEDFHPVTMPAGEWAAMLADVRDALDRITREHSTILLLDALGSTYEEISADQAIVMGTVKSRLNRARIRIREEVEGVAA